ncbi:MAG: hypothetical protein Q7S09_02310 [bacterium]|nr:hypothetical protein [bacterium]
MVITVKKVALAFVGIMVGLVLVTGLFLATKWPKSLYDSFRYAQNQRKLMQAIKEADELMKNDTYGGESPEETFAMFLNALKAGDTNLASKYFVLSKQDEWKGNLEKVKNGGQLPGMIEDLTKASQTWQRGEENPGILFYRYDAREEEQTVELSNGTQTTFPAGVYQQTITFLKNINNRWKISQL